MDIDEALLIGLEKTLLEEKYKDSDKFQFSKEEIENYEATKDERDRQRQERKDELERQIKEQNDKIEAERAAEKQQRLEKEEKLRKKYSKD